jgi:hypothetical protein
VYVSIYIQHVYCVHGCTAAAPPPLSIRVALVVYTLEYFGYLVRTAPPQCCHVCLFVCLF